MYVKAMEGGEAFFVATGDLDGERVVLGFSTRGFKELGRGEAVLRSGRSMPCVFMRKILPADPQVVAVDVDYTTLSLAEVTAGLDDIAREAQATFGRLDARQLNWRPDATQWSVAQCFEHLITANRLIFQATEEALTGARPQTIWQRLPILPGLFGRMLIRSQAPTATRKYTASPLAQPATSDIAADIIPRFVEQHRDAVARAQSLDEREASRAIMTSPFIEVITYSVLDAWRLVLAHDCRHVEQARRVTLSPGFPCA